MADGEWLSAPTADLKKDDRLEIVYEDSRPSYFQEKASGLNEPTYGKNPASNQEGLTQPNECSANFTSGMEAALVKPVQTMEEKLLHRPVHISKKAET